MTTAIIVSGASAAGKSLLSEWISQELGLQLLSKDVIKEKLFDELGCETRAKSIELGKASFAALLDQCRNRVLVRESFIVESAFRMNDGPILAATFQNCRTIHVNCTASKAVIISRFGFALRSDRHSVPGRLENSRTKARGFWGGPRQRCKFGSRCFSEMAALPAGCFTMARRCGLRTFDACVTKRT